MSRIPWRWMPALFLASGIVLISQVAFGFLIDDPQSEAPILLVAGLLVALGFALMTVRFVTAGKEVSR